VYQKQNAYIFDFAPERTLTIFDAFANNLLPNPSGDQGVRQENIRTLLNFFPVLGEDAEGRMIELDASQVLTFPQVFKAREVVRRGFLSNLLFANVGGIFRYSEHVKEILDKLPTAKQGKVTKGQPIRDPAAAARHRPRRETSQVDVETVINPKVAALGKARLQHRGHPDARARCPGTTAATAIAKAVTEQTRSKREELKVAYGLTAAQVERDDQAHGAVRQGPARARLPERNIAHKHLDDELKNAATEAEGQPSEAKKADRTRRSRRTSWPSIDATMDSIVRDVVTREETKKEQKRADQTMDDARSHLRGFARTIPMFLMSLRRPRHPPVELRRLHARRRVRGDHRDHREPSSACCATARRSPTEDGTVTKIPGLFDEARLRPGRSRSSWRRRTRSPTTSTKPDREHLRLHPAAEDVAGLHPTAGS
jgi:type II restriction enzyme